MDPKKQRALVEYLVRQNRPVTAKELADFLNFSVRTVKSYISDLNHDAKEAFVFSSHRGYEVNATEAESYLRRHKKQLGNIPQNYEERAAYINRKFLAYHTERLDVYDLADELCYSVETIRADFQKMNRSFASLGVSYELHGDYAALRADEQSLRKLARCTFLNEVPGQMVSYSDIQEVFSDVKADTVKLLLEQALREHDFYVNDFGMLNLVMHLCIIVRRLKSSHTLSENVPFAPDTSGMEYQVTTQLCDQLGALFQIKFTPGERQNIYLLLKANANLSLSRDKRDFCQFIGPELLDFITELLRRMDAKYYINLNSESFFFPFCMHVKNLIFRAEHHRSNANPIGDVVRYSHPMIFDMAVFAAAQISERYHIQIDTGEISYLALHIGGEVERQASNQEKVRTVLLCPAYLDFSTKMYNQLLIHFGEEIELTACVSTPEELGRYRFDLLVTTVDIPRPERALRVVHIPFLGIQKCRGDITDAVEAIRERRRLLILKDEFDRFFSPELFSVNLDGNLTAKDIMRRMADQMEAFGVVQSDFYDRLLERELAASTAFPNIAIPHSMHLDAIKTSVCVMLCPKGVVWGGQTVKIVLTVAIHRMDARIFGELYQALIGLFDNEKNLRQIVDKSTFQEFREQLERMI